MADRSEQQMAGGAAGNLCVGLLAHVDAGKTTLAESILYLSGSLRKPGRVDHGDAFLDTYAMEKARGITIFAKQAQVVVGGRPVTLLDTPGQSAVRTGCRAMYRRSGVFWGSIRSRCFFLSTKWTWLAVTGRNFSQSFPGGFRSGAWILGGALRTKNFWRIWPCVMRQFWISIWRPAK